jgi:hypothetical protein
VLAVLEKEFREYINSDDRKAAIQFCYERFSAIFMMLFQLILKSKILIKESI